MNNIVKYLSRLHNYEDNINCVTILADFYENELKIDLTEEKSIFNNFQVSSIKDLRKIPVEVLLSLKNWTKIDLTNLREYDIIIYSKNNKFSHFAMYVGDNKILNLSENERSALRHFNDKYRQNIQSCIRHRSLAT
jgi:hypothetical protein